MYYYLILMIALVSGCVATNGGGWEFAPCEAVSNAIDALDSVPDETKASAIEGLAWLLGFTGIGAVASPLLSKVASYYRKRDDNKKQKYTPSQEEIESDIYGEK